MPEGIAPSFCVSAEACHRVQTEVDAAGPGDLPGAISPVWA